MTQCWFSSVVHHRWMGAIAIYAAVYVRKMGLVTVCLLIVVGALVVVVLEGLREFAVVYNNQSSLSRISKSCEGLCAIINLNCSSYKTHPLEFCAPTRTSCICLISCHDLSYCSEV